MSIDLLTPRTDTAPGRIYLAQKYRYLPHGFRASDGHKFKSALDGWFHEAIAEAADRASERHARESSAAQPRMGLSKPQQRTRACV